MKFLGEVVEVGSGVSNLQPGDRVVVPFPIACGNCYYCENELFSLCDNSNPNGWMTENLYGQPSGGLFGYSHMLGARREQATTLPETERYMIQSRQHGHAK
jgi:threonine dehydrogenase-like Zn-dependent dehydrogenase